MYEGIVTPGTRVYIDHPDCEQNTGIVTAYQPHPDCELQVWIIEGAGYFNTVIFPFKYFSIDSSLYNEYKMNENSVVGVNFFVTKS